MRASRGIGLVVGVALLLGGLGSAPGTAVGTPTPGLGAVSSSQSSSHVVARSSARSDHVKSVRGRHKWKTKQRIVPVTTGPNDDIKIGIDTRLYLPGNATRKHPQPAIVMTHGFGLTKDSPEVVNTARFFAAHGYTVLTYTSSGFGDSGGCVTLQSADYDVKSAKQLIDKLLEPRRDVLRDRRGVVVGTIGGSYGGGIQLPLAGSDKRIRASVVGRTWNSLQYSLDPNNWVAPGDKTGLTHALHTQGVFKQQWTSLFYALGNSQPASGGGGCPEAKAASGDPVEIANAGACPGYYFPLCATYDSLTATGDASADSRRLIARASASSFLPKVKAAVLLVQGQSDTLFNLNDASATYLELKRRKVPVGMIWNSGGHGGYVSQPGECELYDGAERGVRQMDRCYLTVRSLGWMDHFLRGKKGGRGPALTYYRDWTKYAGKGPNDEQYGLARRFPRKGATTFRLTGSDQLTTGKSVSAATATFTNPAGGSPAAYTETSNFTGPASSPYLGDAPPTEQTGQHVAFTSAPLKKRLISVGIPSARLRITNSNGQDMVFFAKVYDVAPDGTATLIHRLISPVRVPADRVGDPVEIRLAGFAHKFRRGHSVRLVLCSTDQTSYNAKVADVLSLTSAGSTFTVPGRVRG